MGTSYALTVKLGDPALAWVPPIEQSVNGALIAPFAPTGGTSQLSEHHALIVTPTATRDQTTVAIGTAAPAALTGGTWTTGNGAGAGHSFYSMELTNKTESYYFANPYGLTAMGYGMGDYETYYYLSGAAARNLDAAFYIDDVHYQDLDGEVICDPHTFAFRGVIQYAMSGTAGYLKWYIDGVEELSARDDLEWTKYLGRGTYTIRMSVIDMNGETHHMETTITIGCNGLADDTKTVQEYREVVVDVLANDVIPDALFAGSFNLLDSVTLQPLAGTLTLVGAGSSSKLAYHNNGASPLVNNIDSFKYSMTIWDAPTSAYKTFTATAYIYVLQDKGPSSTCYNIPYKVDLTLKPPTVVFNWYNRRDSSALGTGATRTVTSLVDTTFLIKPVIATPANAPYNLAGGFPMGEFTIHVSASGGTKMRWTGNAHDHNWNNPMNWVEVKATYETPVSWIPGPCTDVVMPPAAAYYPELIDSAICRQITIGDRAMLKNPHVLKYDRAYVELKLKPSERSRYVMWSAPLLDMYSGDYHFRSSSNQPQWGDVFMSLFQQKNPDYASSVAAERNFTATFGSVNQRLELGRAFNLRIVSTTQTKDSLFRFPRTETVYNGTTITRGREYRFVTEDMPKITGPQRYELPVYGGTSNWKLIQVVNPYMAYLRMDSFLLNNTNFTSGYYIWNGDYNTGITAVTTFGTVSGYNRYVMTDPSPLPTDNPNLIAPLQSFFVAKNAGSLSTNITKVTLSPNWTTTSPSASYTLRAGEQPYIGELHIKVSQGEKVSHALLVSYAASLPELDSEDMPVLTLDDIPLTLYSFTPGNEPLLINTSPAFQTINLGLRVRDAGETKLEFASLSTFGYDVTLVDKYANKEVNIVTTPAYTFTISKEGETITEINDRFSLRMNYTGVSNERISSSELRISSEQGWINITSKSGLIQHLQVYNLSGSLVYETNTPSASFRLPLQSGQTYLVKAKTGDSYQVEKVYVK
jgi:hypothetical protein